MNIYLICVLILIAVIFVVITILIYEKYQDQKRIVQWQRDRANAAEASVSATNKLQDDLESQKAKSRRIVESIMKEDTSKGVDV